jgi:hypothetical protein
VHTMKAVVCTGTREVAVHNVEDARVEAPTGNTGYTGATPPVERHPGSRSRRSRSSTQAANPWAADPSLCRGAGRSRSVA